MLINQHIVIVNNDDCEIGVGDKMLVHLHGILHRAFSVFVINSNGQLMLQQRAFGKYHSAGLWTNTCCSHALPNMDFEEVIHQRLFEEMGFDCNIQWLFKFQYQVRFDNGLSENEIDHIYVGFYDGEPQPLADEVCNWAWVDLKHLSEDIVKQPHKYTYWFRIVFEQFVSEYNKHCSANLSKPSNLL